MNEMLPVGWRTALLSEVAEIGSGATKGRRFNGPTIELPYLSVANVQVGRIDLSEIKTIEIGADEVDKYRLVRDDVVLTEGGDPDKLGRGTIWKGEVEPCLHQNHIFRVRCNKQILLPEYLAAFLQSQPARTYFLRAAKQTTGIASINKTQLSQTPIILPPLPEQRRIAAILDKADTIRRKRREAIALTEELLRSVFLEMFGDPVTNPKGWPTVNFGNLIVYGPNNGLYRPATDYGSGTPIVRIDSFYDGEVTGISDLKRVRIPPDQIEQFGLEADDILINRVNSPKFLGKSALVPDLAEPIVYESNMMRLRVDSGRADRESRVIAETGGVGVISR